MSVPYTTTTGTAPTGGWTCYSCGNWVPNGVTHQCTTALRVQPTYTFTPSLSDADIERIARRVVELLKSESASAWVVDASKYGASFEEPG